VSHGALASRSLIVVGCRTRSLCEDVAVTAAVIPWLAAVWKAESGKEWLEDPKRITRFRRFQLYQSKVGYFRKTYMKDGVLVQGY